MTIEEGRPDESEAANHDNINPDPTRADACNGTREYHSGEEGGSRVTAQFEPKLSKCAPTKRFCEGENTTAYGGDR